MPVKEIINGIIQLIEKHRLKEKEKFALYIKDTYIQAKNISTDLLRVISNLEQLLENNASPNDIIGILKKERNNLLADRRYIRHILTISYFEDPSLKKFVHGILTILNGGDLKPYMEIETKEKSKMGHSLLDIVDYYDSIRLYAQNNETIIRNELLRVFHLQKQYIETGVDEMTKAFVILQDMYVNYKS